jgi:hypothetical protein
MATTSIDPLMPSINFEFLRPKWPDLAGHGGFSEAYAHGDPIGAISKLRTFCEQISFSSRSQGAENLSTSLNSSNQHFRITILILILVIVLSACGIPDPLPL